MIKLFVLVAFLLLINYVKSSAQQLQRISITVKDSVMDEPIANTSIKIEEINRTVISNSYGYQSFKVKPGPMAIRLQWACFREKYFGVWQRLLLLEFIVTTLQPEHLQQAR